MRAADTKAGLTKLAECTAAVKQWYLANGLLLNEGKSEVFIAGTSYQLQAASAITSVSVAGASLPVSESLKTLGVVIDRRLTFSSHVASVVKSCNYHAQAIRHIRPILTTELAQTLTCSVISSRLDYCNSLLYGAPAEVVGKLQRAQNYAARVVTQSSRRTRSRPLLQTLHWLPIRQRILYKIALLTYKARAASTPKYLNDLLSVHTSERSLRSASRLTLNVPATRTEFAKRAFRSAAPAVWNSLPDNVVTSQSVTVFKSRLKTFLFAQAYTNSSD
jgi:hypothetical protein